MSAICGKSVLAEAHTRDNAIPPEIVDRASLKVHVCFVK